MISVPRYRFYIYRNGHVRGYPVAGRLGRHRRVRGRISAAAGAGTMILLKVLPLDDPLRFAAADISFLSVFRSTEGEFLLPPGTYFSTAGRGGRVVEDKVKKLVTVEVVPRSAAACFG